jgi:hypothetical protein
MVILKCQKPQAQAWGSLGVNNYLTLTLFQTLLRMKSVVASGMGTYSKSVANFLPSLKAKSKNFKTSAVLALFAGYL